jgi:hypothetical protein
MRLSVFDGNGCKNFLLSAEGQKQLRLQTKIAAGAGDRAGAVQLGILIAHLMVCGMSADLFCPSSASISG